MPSRLRCGSFSLVAALEGSKCHAGKYQMEGTDVGPLAGDWIGKVIADLLAHTLEALGRRAGEAISGGEKEQALRRCLEAGVVALLARTSLATPDERNLMDDIFRDFLLDPRVSVELGGLVRGQALNMERMEALFEAAGYDPSTLPELDFRQAMQAFEAAFLVSAQEEPTLQGIIQTSQLMTQTRLQHALLAEMRQLVAFLREARPGSVSVQGSEILAVREGTGQAVTYRLDPQERQRLKAEFDAQLRWRDAQEALAQHDWDRAEELAREALDLDPGLSGIRRELGLAFGEIVARRFGREHGVRDTFGELHEVLAQARHPVPNNETVPVIEAVLWLDEALRYGEDADGAVSAMLARLYGATQRFGKMLRALHRAVQRAPEGVGALRQPDSLGMFVHACSSDPARMREIGEVLGITLPATKADVRRTIEEMDLEDVNLATHGIVWSVMGQHAPWVMGLAPRFPTVVRIFAREEEGRRVAMACYTIPEPHRPAQSRCIPDQPGAFSEIRDMVDELARLFLFVTPV